MTHYGENVFFLSPEYRIGLGFFQNAANSLEIRFFFLIVIRAESDIILSPLSRLSVRISKKARNTFIQKLYQCQNKHFSISKLN